MPKKYRPSNHTEGEIFMSAWCYQCEREKQFRETDEKPCAIVFASMVSEIEDENYPTEWNYDDNDAPQCTAFVPEGEEIPFRDELTVDMFGDAA